MRLFFIAIFLFLFSSSTNSYGQDSTRLGKFIFGIGFSWGFQHWSSSQVRNIGNSLNSGKYTSHDRPNSYYFLPLYASYIPGKHYHLNIKVFNEYENYGTRTAESGIPKIDTAYVFNRYSDLYELNVASRLVVNNNPGVFTYLEFGIIPGFQKSEKWDFEYIREDSTGHAVGRYTISEENNTFSFNRLMLSFSLGIEMKVPDDNFYFDVSASYYINVYQAESRYINLENSKWSINAGVGYRINKKKHKSK